MYNMLDSNILMCSQSTHKTRTVQNSRNTYSWVFQKRILTSHQKNFIAECKHGVTKFETKWHKSIELNLQHEKKLSMHDENIRYTLLYGKWKRLPLSDDFIKSKWTYSILLELRLPLTLHIKILAMHLSKLDNIYCTRAFR